MATLAHPIAASNSRTSAAAPVILIGRILFSLIFLMAGFTHFAGQTIAFAASQGVPLAWIVVPISGIIAAIGALSLLLGYRAKLGAWLIVLFLVAVTPMHKFWGVADPMTQQMQLVMFMKNLAMLGGALIISQLGSGPWSLDNRNLESSQR